MASSESSRPLRRARAIILGVVGGLFLFGLLAVAVIVVQRRNAPPIIAIDDVDAAEARWREHGPVSYDMDLVIEGNRPGDVHIEVRHGEVTAMTRDGVAPQQRRTWVYWTVPEQFETIRQDFDSAADPESPFGAAAGSQAILRAEFDPEYGFPWRYERQVLGANLDVAWRVTRFQPLP